MMGKGAGLHYISVAINDVVQVTAMDSFCSIVVNPNNLHINERIHFLSTAG